MTQVLDPPPLLEQGSLTQINHLTSPASKVEATHEQNYEILAEATKWANLEQLSLAKPKNEQETESSSQTPPPGTSFWDTFKAMSNKELLKWLAETRLLGRILPDAANMLSLFGNVSSSVAGFLKLPEQTQKFINAIANFGTKTFLTINSIINTIEQLSKENYLCATGYGLDSLIAQTVKDPYKLTLARGISSGLYHAVNGLNIIAGRSSTYTSLVDHLTAMGAALKESISNFFNKNVLKNLLNPQKAMFAVSGGLLSMLGTGLWAISGKTAIPSTVRDIGSFLKSIEQVNIKHLLEHKRKFFFASGINMIIATGCDLFSEWFPNSKSYLKPLSLALDNLAKYLLRHSQNCNEI